MYEILVHLTGMSGSRSMAPRSSCQLDSVFSWTKFQAGTKVVLDQLGSLI